MKTVRPLTSSVFFVFLGASLAIAAAAQTNTREHRTVLAAADGSVRIETISTVATPSSVNRGVQTCVDITGIQSWDALDDADNVTIDIAISNSLKVVGIAWDVGIATLGDSWIADASVLASNSDGIGDPNGIILAPGFQVEAPGDQALSSGGVVMFADESLPDIEPNADGIIQLQFFETFDDNIDAIDANWRAAASPVTCPGIWLELDELQRPGGPGIPPDIDPNAVPLDQPLALLLLFMLVGAVGIQFLRDRT